MTLRWVHCLRATRSMQVLELQPAVAGEGVEMRTATARVAETMMRISRMASCVVSTPPPGRRTGRDLRGLFRPTLAGQDC